MAREDEQYAALLTNTGKSCGFRGLVAPYVPLGIVRLMDLPILVGEEFLLLIGSGAVVLALAIAVFLPNVPRIFGYREYRGAPEHGAFMSWRPNAAWQFLLHWLW